MSIDNILNITENVLNGEYCAVDFYVYLNNLEKQIKEAKEKINSAAISEIEKGYIFTGYNITVKQKTTYDYAHLSDWQRLKAQIYEVENLAKYAYQISHSIVNDKTGEVIEPAIATYSKPFITVIKTK